MTAKTLLIVGHAPSPNCKKLCEAVLSGAQSDCFSNIKARWASSFEVDATQVLKADAIILFTTENFGYMNGALKDFFERIYYPCLENPTQNDATPYHLIVKGGQDGHGAVTSVERIVTGLKWRPIAPPLILSGRFKTEFTAQCNEAGMTLAAALDADMV